MALLVLCAGFLAPIVLRGRVIFPHDNAFEVGLPRPVDLAALATRKFSDQSSYYVPEIHRHLHGDRSGWLSTWNPSVELGRPMSHLSGFSPAFVLTRVLTWFTGDAFVLYTALTLVTLVLTGVFAFLFLRALELHPWACFAGAASLAFSCFAIYWLTFVMLLAGVCWTLAILWLVVRFLEKPTIALGLGLAFCVHALLLTAYPQQIVWHAWLLAAFTIARSWRGRVGAARVLALAGCIVLGFAFAAPVYADVALAASRAARSGTDASFALESGLPVVHFWADLAETTRDLFDAWWGGDPMSDPFLRFNGLCLTPLFAALFLVSWIEGEWRRTGLWLAFVLVCTVLTFSHAALEFAVRHLGLHLSVFPPLRAALIPFAVAGAYALDRILRTGFRRPGIVIATASCAPACALAGWLVADGPLDPLNVVIGLSVFAGFVVLVIARKTWIVPLLVVAGVAHYGESLVLARPERTIATTSPLVERLRELTSDGSRYAIVGKSRWPPLLPPNEEALLGLRSVHSYDSLSSRIYQAWCSRVSTVGTLAYGRDFLRIADDSRLGVEDMWYSGIRVLVSKESITAPGFEDAGVVDGIHLYVRASKPVLTAQLEGFDLGADGTAHIRGPMAEHAQLAVVVQIDRDDLTRVTLSASPHETLLLESRQYHPQWIARSAGRQLRTVLVNDFWLGVRVPPDTEEVELTFEPWTRWMWIVHAVLALGALAAAVFSIRSASHRGR